MTGARARVVIADDHEPTRYMLERLIESDCEVVAVAANGQEAIEVAERERPDLIILDVSMPVMGGFEAAQILHERAVDGRIIFASQHADKAFADEAFRLGGRGYVVKQAAATEMLEAVREVREGRLFRSPLIQAR